MKDNLLVRSLEDLNRHYPKARPSSLTKVQNRLSERMQTWLRHSPFFVLASNGDSGIDCSPRGDAPGQAFHILDEQTLAIPDRQGNNRIDTLRNIVADPQVALVFLIPGVEEALRVKGHATICADPELLAKFAVDDVLPATVILVSVESAYVQNARAIRSSQLWMSEHFVPADTIPSAAELYIS